MSWGTGVTLAFTGFVGFILFLVYSSFQQNIDLVAEDYYQQELAYQQVIDESNNYDALEEQLLVTETPTSIEFIFPHNELQKIKGTLTFFRPSNKKDDLFFKVTGKDLTVDKTQLVAGLYLIKASWVSGDKKYFREQSLFVQK